MNLSTKQKQNHGHREQTGGCQGGGGRGRDGLGSWGYRCELLYTAFTQQVLLCSTENYAQYPTINQNGKEYTDMYV